MIHSRKQTQKLLPLYSGIFLYHRQLPIQQQTTTTTMTTMAKFTVAIWTSNMQAKRTGTRNWIQIASSININTNIIPNEEWRIKSAKVIAAFGVVARAVTRGQSNDIDPHQRGSAPTVEQRFAWRTISTWQIINRIISNIGSKWSLSVCEEVIFCWFKVCVCVCKFSCAEKQTDLQTHNEWMAFASFHFLCTVARLNYAIDIIRHRWISAFHPPTGRKMWNP